MSLKPSLSVSIKPSAIPSPLVSVPPASITSGIPSLSASKSKRSNIPSSSLSPLGYESGLPSLLLSDPVVINGFVLATIVSVPLVKLFPISPSTVSSRPSLSVSFLSVPSVLMLSTFPFPSVSTPPASTISAIPSLSASKSK